jgi:hypothetical protein
MYQEQLAEKQVRPPLGMSMERNRMIQAPSTKWKMGIIPFPSDTSGEPSEPFQRLLSRRNVSTERY